MMKGATILAKRLLGLAAYRSEQEGTDVLQALSFLKDPWNQQEVTMDKTEFENWSKVKAA